LTAPKGTVSTVEKDWDSLVFKEERHASAKRSPP